MFQSILLMFPSYLSFGPLIEFSGGSCNPRTIHLSSPGLLNRAEGAKPLGVWEALSHRAQKPSLGFITVCITAAVFLCSVYSLTLDVIHFTSSLQTSRFFLLLLPLLLLYVSRWSCFLFSRENGAIRAVLSPASFCLI